jgi:hypothetical protein
MKNLSKSVILILILCLVFVSGILVASYEIFPYSELKSIKNELEKTPNIPSFEANNVSSLIHINNLSSIDETRNNLNLFLWNEKNITDDLPDKIEKNFFDDRYSDLQNLDSIDKFSINMEDGVNSIAYFFKPTNDNGKLIIYHQGHRGDFIHGKQTIEYFLEKNYSVMAFSMPLLGMNSQPIIEHSQFGTIKIQSHNQFELLDERNYTPIKFFIEPIIVSLNYINTQYVFDSIDMIGISGGGWVTTLVSALDDRINHSFSIAGSYPMFLRSDAKNFGDYEQHNLELYTIANYLDLYVMASSGSDRKFIQIFNKFDPCCFDGSSFSSYEEQIKEAVINLGDGYFEIYLDDTHSEHIISNHALEIIINEIIR